MNKPTMLVIGFGRMGRKFAEIFSEGFQVRVMSSRNVSAEAIEIGCEQARNLSHAVRAAEYILLAVPIHALDEVIEQVNPHLGPDAIAFDVCSARVVADRKMERLSCRWFALHAGGIFGEPDSFIVEFLAERGHHHHAMSAAEHDQKNSINALAHFIGMALEETLSVEERDAFGPAGNHLLRLIEHLRANAPATYWESQICNPYTSDQRERLIEALRRYSDRLSDGEFPFFPSLSRS